jgi:hypothetical protein
MSDTGRWGRHLLVFIGALPLLLTGFFATLKWARAIDWPWMWVLMPVWIALAGLVPIYVAVRLAVKFMLKTGSRIP